MHEQPIITRADDFGASPGTNEAILDAIDAGFIRNVGIMMTARHVAHRFRDLIARQGEVCLGLHAVIHSEWRDYRWGPVADPATVRSLLREDGTFLESPKQSDGVSRCEEIMIEIEAQLAALRALGVEPRYLDAHMGFVWLNGVDAAVADLCQRERLVYGNAARYQCVKGRLPGDAPVDPLEGKRPVWVYHPAYRDAVSEQFYLDQPSEHVAASRAQEAEFLASSDPCDGMRSEWGVKTLRYDE